MTAFNAAHPNTGSPAGWQQGLPDLSVQQTIEDIKFVADNECIGIYIDGVWEHWATQGPQFYVMTQLLWDPNADANEILDDYYTRGFGPVKPPSWTPNAQTAAWWPPSGAHNAWIALIIRSEDSRPASQRRPHPQPLRLHKTATTTSPTRNSTSPIYQLRHHR